ncbi:SLC25A23S [Lepeophtheirus salmonis]|uniref:SLC25A23S n=1 Tax=Lepeophtheirus salmonis TaxID=72036 RepID=A0A7R8CFM8_LEPSM|nr:SLC25A23S [Lepeophtheirus salmonis]CAF2802577.1 SLC25A23S [Lepeophtheirus salmonis]
MRDEKELKAELHRLERLFHHLDRNKDGVVGIEDLIEGLHQMGYYHISRQQIDDFLKLSDENKSGNLILSEFVNYLREHEKQLHLFFIHWTRIRMVSFASMKSLVLLKKWESALRPQKLKDY